MSRLFGNKIKVLGLLYLAISNPLYNINSDIFWLVSIILLFGILIFLNKFDSKKNTYGLYTIFEDLSMKYIYVIIWFLIFLIIGRIIEDTKYNTSIPMIVIFCWSIAGVLIYFVVSSLIINITRAKEIIENTKNHKYKMLALSVIMIFLIFILPDIVFGVIYNLFFAVFGNSKLSFLESFHLSMLIGNTLPIGEYSIKYISIIESNKYIFSFQIVHVILNKIINLFIVGVILNYLITFINTKNNNEKVKKYADL